MLGNPAFRAGSSRALSFEREIVKNFRGSCKPSGKRGGLSAGVFWGDRVAEEDTVVSGVAGRYASALFSLAQDERQAESVAEALTRFDALIAESPDLQRMVRSPVFSAADQLKALDAILAQAEIGGIAANFIRLVATKRRLFFIREMIADYRKLYDKSRGVTRAEVTSAAALSDANVAALKESLRAASGGREVALDMKVDPSIIGGLIVKLGSRMVDGSLKTKLNAIRLAMKEVG
jgi:F-type H+-transporting ATPase subunit delta